MEILFLGTNSKPTQEYKYLGGRCRHYKLIGESGYHIKETSNLLILL